MDPAHAPLGYNAQETSWGKALLLFPWKNKQQVTPLLYSQFAVLQMHFIVRMAPCTSVPGQIKHPTLFPGNSGF